MINDIQLDSLYQFKSEDIVKKIKSFRKQYTKNNPCGCATNLPKNQLLNCQHMKIEINKKFKKELDILEKITLTQIANTIIDTDCLTQEQKTNIINEMKKM